ncbi:MAG TPA: hypothetical protein H9903_15140 [Candidatus Aquabacterium excrementipullorum]|nr:hypothetical protein [Candidatus Aquabacterium excrementipullorum]
MSVLAACGGGGGGGDDDYPSNNTVVVNSATTSTPTGSYRIDPTNGYADTETVSGGRVLEYAYSETSNFGVYVIFYRDDTNKYLVFFEDNSDLYVCHSGNVSTLELTELANGSPAGITACGGRLLIDASQHRVRASKVSIPGYTNTAAKVTLSANVSWSL